MLRAAYVGVDFRDLSFSYYCRLNQTIGCPFFLLLLRLLSVSAST
jgi:hypothetical protein